MASAERADVFKCDIEKLYSVITDYEKYPEFVEGVESVEVLEQSENGARVKYSVNIVKEFTYILELKHEKPNSVSWTFESGDLFKKNSGSWSLSDKGNGEVNVVYSIDADFKIFAPKMIVNKVISNNLPSMMDAYYQRATEV